LSTIGGVAWQAARLGKVLMLIGFDVPSGSELRHSGARLSEQQPDVKRDEGVAQEGTHGLFVRTRVAYS
jgi:hypothetical protein